MGKISLVVILGSVGDGFVILSFSHSYFMRSSPPANVFDQVDRTNINLCISSIRQVIGLLTQLLPKLLPAFGVFNPLPIPDIFCCIKC